MTDHDLGGAGRLGAADNNVRPLPPKTVSIGVERYGTAVQIKLNCADEYAAIALYEEVVRSCKVGSLQLNVNAKT